MNMIVQEQPRELLTVLSPMGTPPKIDRKAAAPRPDSLDGKTVYLVDCRFNDSIELLKQVKVWFEEHMPSVTARIISLRSQYAEDDPVAWTEIKEKGHAAIVGVGHCSACTPAVVTHAITLETKYGVPTVAIHTDKFDKVARSVSKMAGLPLTPFAYVPQPVMGRSPAELKAYVEGADPLSGVPVMQEVIESLTNARDQA